MTNDEQREIINRIVYNLLDTLSDGTVTKKFKKLYEGGINAKNIDKNLRNIEAIGLPNIADNVLDDSGDIRKSFMTEKTFTIEVNGKEETQTTEEPDNVKLSETTNRATALTYAYALFIELDKLYNKIDGGSQEKTISDLEKRIETLESEIKILRSSITLGKGKGKL